ncbi:MAG: acyl-[ACP]--phospholipid O-acyltransferase [Nitrospira sp.]|nr:acyl-[ACP]--phospholipid O-acyltransferase [Nitrospira sp.]
MSTPTPISRTPLRGLLIAQFCGAFNDNAWKLMVALLAIQQVSGIVDSGLAFEAASQHETTVAFVVFTLPLMLVSIVAGTLADRVSKRTIIVTMKGAEVGLMGAGTVALFINPSGGLLPLIVLAGMGVHSALFGPAKYGILPEILPHDRLSAGNGVLEMSTFLAILAGTAAGGLLLDQAQPMTWLAPLALSALALGGFIASFSIPPVPPARTHGGVLETVGSAIRILASDRVLRLAVIGSVFFWTIASLVGQDILVYAKAILQLSDSLSGLPLASLSVGIGVGAVTAGRLSGARVETGLIPLGTIGIAIFLFLIGVIKPGLWGTLLLMGGLGVACGLFVVPLNALIQWRAPEDRRGSIIALANTCVFGGILVGSLSGGGLTALGLSTTEILLAAAIATVGGTIWALWLLPEAFLRLSLVLLTHSLYRVQTIGLSHVPQTGGALLVSNHMSFIDGFLLMASLDRPIRFVVDVGYATHPVLKRLMAVMGVFPISSSGDPRMILSALRGAGQAIDHGDLVCIFPEGQITRTGTLLPFREGFERIVKGRTVPIIPVHLDRVWGSLFSFEGGRFLTKVPAQLPYPVTVSFGSAMPADTSAHEARRVIQELGESAWEVRKTDRAPLHRSLIASWRRHLLNIAMGDASRPQVSCWKALVGAIVFGRLLNRYWQGEERVGLLIPPSVPGALVNVAALLTGRTSVNLNYTVGRLGLESAVQQAGLKTIVSSRQFVEKAKLELPEGVTWLWLEELTPTVTAGQKLVAMLLAACAPVRLIEWACGHRKPATMNDIATIIFSSGSTGEPKGVMLSHFNIDSNVEATSQVMHMSRKDHALGILPFFHSFGYMIFWFCMRNGVGLYFHASPLDVGAIGELVAKCRITLLIATPTFLQLYQRRCTPEQLSTLRIVMTGAEKLQPRLAQAFEEKFGLRPVEGYGVTECAPVIAVNGPDFRAAGFYQPATRRGTVGQPLPGVSIRIVDPETGALLPPGTSGMLWVKGPNVMSGYLNREDLTAKVLRDGWYVTGDMAIVDEDGFLTITDRLSRFSKIGGEMVPHGRVEEALHEVAGAESQVFAVTAIPDDKKGERLAVLHTLAEERIPAILEKLVMCGLPNLFIPQRQAFIKVEAIPVLGTGKLDLRALKHIALDRLKAVA